MENILYSKIIKPASYSPSGTIETTVYVTREVNGYALLKSNYSNQVECLDWDISQNRLIEKAVAMPMEK